MSIGIITPNIFWYLRSLDRLNSFVKKCAVLYDQIILHTDYSGVNVVYEFGGPGYLAMNLADNENDAKALERLCAKEQCFLRPAAFGVNESVLSGSDGNKDRALDIFPQLSDASVFTQAFPEFGLSHYQQVLSDIGIMISIREVVSDCVGLFDERHRASVLQDVKISTSHSSMKNLENFDIQIPEFGEFTWEEIEAIRKDRYIRKFREFVGDDNMVKNAMGEIWSFIGKSTPDIKSTAMLGIFSNIPFPVANPISVGSSLFQFARAKKMSDEYGWLFFLDNVRRTIGEAKAD